MAFCEQCGAQLPSENAQICPACGASVTPPDNYQSSHSRAVYQGTGAPAAVPASGPSSGRIGYVSEERANSMSKKIELAKDEQIVKQYQCTEIRNPRCFGYLTVTNKRILFHGQAPTSRIRKEVVLDSVAGIDSFYGLNVKGFGVFLAVLILLAGIVLSFEEFDTPVFLLIGITLFVFILCLSIRRCFFLSIYSSKATGAPISIGEGARSSLGNRALYTLTGKPSTDTDKMLDELGALIQDLQTFGDPIIEKWKQ